jgi:hypothetical protein
MFQHWSKRTKVIGGIVVGVLVIVLAGGIYGISTGKIAVRADSGAVSGKLTSTTGACPKSNIAVDLITIGGGMVKTQTDAYGNFSFSAAPYNKSMYVFANPECSNNWGSCIGQSADFTLTSSSPSKSGLTINLAAVSYVYRVAVSTPSGSPISGAKVTVKYTTTSSDTFTTGSSGYVTFGDGSSVSVTVSHLGSSASGTISGRTCTLSAKGFILPK